MSESELEPSGFNRFKLGQFEVTTILDGKRAYENTAETFGIDQPPETVAELLAGEYLPADHWMNSFTPTLVRTGDDLVLFDTGLGEGARQNGLGRLRERLGAAGHTPEDVTIVVITHFHGDHIGGLMEGEAPAFPNARYVAGQVEYDFWTAPERLSGPMESGARNVEAKVKPLADKMAFIGDGDSVVSGITAMAAFGHTPGHMIFMLESDGKQLVLTADTANHYVASLQRPDWHVRFDVDKEAGVATRKKVFDMVAADRLPFIGYHMPPPAIGFVEKVGEGYRFIPETYQLDF
nr:MBL fold metallo-hydrolase [Mesorhizobium xinjiangense]